MGGSNSNGMIYSTKPVNSTKVTSSNDVEIIRRCNREKVITVTIATQEPVRRETAYQQVGAGYRLAGEAVPGKLNGQQSSTREPVRRETAYQQVGAGYRLAGEPVPGKLNGQQSSTREPVRRGTVYQQVGAGYRLAGEAVPGKLNGQQSSNVNSLSSNVCTTRNDTLKGNGVKVHDERDQIKNCTAINMNQSSKHDLFLQRVISSFNLKQLQLLGRGFYCNLCDIFEIYQRRTEIHGFHGDNETHKANLQNVKNSSSIKLHTCKSCNVEFFGDDAFWIGHNGSDYHKALEKIKPDDSHRNRCRTGDNRSCSRNCKPQKSSTSGSMHGNALKEGQIVKTDRNVKYSLLVSGLPENATRGDIVKYFKGFGYIENMQVNGQCTAKLTFRLRIAAKNIVDNGVPISINGKVVNLSLIEEFIN